MANKYVVSVVDMSYIGPGGGTVQAPRKTISAPYQGSSLGQIDVPAATADATEFVVPFGTIGTGATLARIDNNTDVRMAIKINGAASTSHALPPGASMLIESPVADSGTTPGLLLSISCTTEAIATLGGTIDFWVFGDPT
jgi:hypothetical protein